MMDCDPAKEEYQCVKDIMDEMIKNICDQPASNSEGRTQEKEKNEESEVPLNSKRLVLTRQLDTHLTSDDDKVSQKKSSDCKYRDVLDSLFDIKATADEDMRPTVDYLVGSERRCVNTDYIPLSCPVKTSGDDILSEEDKSFLVFLDDMRSLTTDEKPCAMAEQHPVFHVHLGNQPLKETAESLPVSEQTSVSNMLTIQALVNSQESDHFNCVDIHDQGKEDFMNPETKVLFSLPSGNKKRCRANTFQMHSSFSMRQSGSSYNEGHSLENYTKDFIASGRADAPEENEESVSSLNLDKFEDNLPLYTGNMSDDSDQSQLLFPKESHQFCCLDQFVNRQPQSVYGATDEKATAKEISTFEQTFPDRNAEITGVTRKSSTTNTSSSASLTQDSLDLIKCDGDKDNQVFSDQTARPSVFNVESNVETTKLQRGNTSPIRKDCETGHVDQIESSARHHAENISSSDNELDCSSSTANIRLVPENDTSQIKSEHLLVCELSVVQDQVSRPNEVIAFDSGKLGREIINKKCGATGTMAEHVLQNPEITKENKNRPDQITADSDFKEETDTPLAIADVENDNDLEEPVMSEQQNVGQVKTSQCQQEHIPNTPKDKTLIAQIPDTLIQEDFNLTENMKCTVQEESCLKQEWSDQVGDAEFQTRCNMQEAVNENVTRSSQHQNIRPQLLASEDATASKLIIQNQSNSQLQQSVIIQHTTEATELNRDDNTAQYENPPCSTSSYAVALHDEELDQEIISYSSEQCPHFQSKTVHRISDQQFPDKDHLVPDQIVAFQGKDYILSETEESLYKNEEGKLQEARLPTPTFKWKYRPSCDGEDEDLMAPVETESALGNIQPLITGQCSRRLRVGLSRKQKVKRLHKNVN